MKKIKASIRRHPALALLFAIEFCVLIAYGSCFFRPVFYCALTADDFQGTAAGEAAYVVRAESDGTRAAAAQSIDSRPFSLSSGFYDMRITYDLEPYDADAKARTASSLRISAGKHRVKSDLVDGSVELTYGQHDATTRVYVRYFSKISGASVLVNVGDNVGDLTVTSLEIREYAVYRYARFLFVFLGFALADALLLALFCESPFRLRAGARRSLAVLTMIVLYASLLCFQDFLINGHDWRFHLSRIASIAEMLRAGQFPVRLSTGALNGYGYPFSIYYGDLFLYLPAVMYNAGFPLYFAYNTYAFVVNAITCAIAYWSFRKIFGNGYAVLAGAIIYTLSAYRVTDVYLRFAVGEYTAMAFLPLVVYGFWNLLRDRPAGKIGLREYLPVVIGLTGVIQSHLLTAVMCAMFICLALLIRIKAVFRRHVFAALVKCALLTVLLNLWFLLPFMASMGVNIRLTGKTYLERMQDQGAYPAQLFNLFYSWAGKSISNSMTDNMPLNLDFSLVIGIAVYVLLRVRERGLARREDGFLRLTLFFGAIALWMSSTLFPWYVLGTINSKILLQITKLQFSWRFLAVATTILTFTAIGVIQKVATIKRTLGLALGGVMVCLVFIASGYFVLNRGYSGNSASVYDDNGYQMIVAGGEYLLAGADIEKITDTSVLADEGVVIESYERTNGLTTVACENTGAETARVTLPIFHYPNYHAVDVKTGAEFAIKTGDNKRISVVLPAGYNGTFTVRYREPLSWRASEIISAAAALGLVVFLLTTRRKKARAAIA